MKKTVWMKVTHDKYELPVAVADTAEELAKICGTTANSIRSSISHVKNGRKKWTPYVKVVLQG